jgi:hypothetical protein
MRPECYTCTESTIACLPACMAVPREFLTARVHLWLENDAVARYNRLPGAKASHENFR